jgi:hypothetical protein
MVRKKKNINEFIKKVASDNGMTVQDLSTAIGRPAKTLSHSLRGECLSVVDLANCLHVTGGKLIIIYNNHNQEIEIGNFKEKTK